MTIVALTCPECGRQKVYNGRGRCPCGVYLIHHTGRPAILDPERRTYVMTEQGWQQLEAPEPRSKGRTNERP